MNRFSVVLCATLAAAEPLCSEIRILPTPHYLEERGSSLRIPKGGAISISTSHSGDIMQLAADLLADGFRRASLDVQLGRKRPGAATIELWNWADAGKAPVRLNELDKQALADPAHGGQSYVIRRADNKTICAVGSSPQGVLLAVTTLLQAIGTSDQGIEIPSLYIRDYPDFSTAPQPTGCSTAK
jgi:hypothetical protein